jgi:HD-like signal output (HDOD) protein
MLRPLRHEWQVEFARSGPEALSVLAQSPFDVVVSDMRMPGMDGAQLLNEVMRRYPRIVRIVLSGHSDWESILRSVGPAHQFLAKPCDADTLKATVVRACVLRDLLTDEMLKQLVSQLKSLPSLPSLYLELMEELQSKNSSIQKVGQIVAKDVGMSAKILQLVNSAFFGLCRHVSSPAQAVVFLGADTIKALVLSVHIFSQLDSTRLRNFSIDALWNHSLQTSAFSKLLSKTENADPKIVDYAGMAGLLHDSGKLVLAANLPDHYNAALNLSREQNLTLREAEREVFGATHAEIGAYLLGLWGLPDPIVEAVAFHHHPTRCLDQQFSPLTAVHVANALQHEIHPTPAAKGAPQVDFNYLKEIGLVDRLPVWRDVCRAASAEGAKS